MKDHQHADHVFAGLVAPPQVAEDQAADELAAPEGQAVAQVLMKWKMNRQRLSDEISRWLPL